MFLILHRIYLAILFALLGCVAYFIYQHRVVFTPATDFAHALWIRQDAAPVVAAEISGDVVQVIDLSSFQFKDPAGYLYNVRLAGLDFLAANARNSEGAELRRAGSAHLSQLVLSNKVDVKFSFISEHRSGVGTVYLGKTNVNADMAAAGFARPKRQYLKGLSVDQIYALIRAERAAKLRETGMWNEEEMPMQLTAGD